MTRIPFVLLDIGDSMIKDVVKQENESLPTKRERPCPTFHGGRFAGGEMKVWSGIGKGKSPHSGRASKRFDALVPSPSWRDDLPSSAR